MCSLLTIEETGSKPKAYMRSLPAQRTICNRRWSFSEFKTWGRDEGDDKMAGYLLEIKILSRQRFRSVSP